MERGGIEHADPWHGAQVGNVRQLRGRRGELVFECQDSQLTRADLLTELGQARAQPRGKHRTRLS